jgi:UDP-N-acetylmuramoyl-L-alanyl-D-glutamate--2,6-diaminopimelate ligase
MRIADLIQGLGIRIAPSEAVSDTALRDIRICDITEDSRTVLPGSLFIARKGEKSDGRQFVKGAIDAGAVAILTDDLALALPAQHRPHGPVALLHADDLPLATAQLAERFYGDPSSKMMVIGVTGTNGKTTTTFLIHQILNALGVRCGLIGTVVIDDGTEVAAASLTTPPALELSRTMARMHEAGCAAAVMEVSSHSLHQHRVGAIRFKAGVFTNLTHDHLDYHKTMESYAAVKGILFAMLPADGAAIVNIQDLAHSKMVAGCKASVVRCAVDGEGAMPITGGTAPETVRRARVVGVGTASTDVEFTGFGPQAQVVRVPLIGAFNVMNALQAVGTVHAVFGGDAPDRFSFAAIADALAKAAPPPGRVEPVTRDGEALSVFVDYAHTDDALRTVLSTVRGAMNQRAKSLGIPAREAGKLWCVFGCGGDRDKTKRPKMGKAAAELADRIVVTSDNPRTEDPRVIIAEVEAGIPVAAKGKTVGELDREKAIRLAIREAVPGDVVVIAGKGHEDYQILPDPAKPGATITRHFDDREIARSAVEARGIRPRMPVRVRVEDENSGEGDDLDLSAGASMVSGA